ncbi:hypothetical protein [Sphingorhabdus contaminans]|uniref:hypothetical protein n=1 Tax=Sphingorhabdus contaminans TaxID=1343899 RepID=UPI003D2E3433
MESNLRNTIAYAFLALSILPTTACNKAEKLPSNDLLSSKGHAADMCSATRFSEFKNLRHADHNGTDIIINAAWRAAANATGKQPDIFNKDYCSFEVLASPNRERCFQFYLKKPSAGGDVQLCINGEQKVSRVYLDE